MANRSLLLYAVGGLLVLGIIYFIIQVVSAVVSTVIFAVEMAVLLAVLGGLGYVGYKAYSLLSGRSSGGSSTTAGSSTDELSTGVGSTRSDDLQQKYLNGEISEEEFERRLERQLDNNEFDSIDRELQREQS
ncbi:MAG: hypothetical protein ACI9K3_000511 [Halovenus sp.]|jgi:hypothetical protein